MTEKQWLEIIDNFEDYREQAQELVDTDIEIRRMSTFVMSTADGKRGLHSDKMVQAGLTTMAKSKDAILCVALLLKYMRDGKI